MLCCVDLCGVIMCGVNLIGVDLIEVDMCEGVIVEIDKEKGLVILKYKI